MNYYIINDTEQKDAQLIGSGLEKCLIVINKKEYESTAEKLEQILKAVGLDKKKDVVILLLDGHELHSALSVIPKFGIRNVVSFGKRLKSVFPNLEKEYYQILKSEDYNWLAVPTLTSIMNNSEEKMKLWKALQLMFKKRK